MKRAVQLLREGCVVAFPTDTVYGLAARYDDGAAVEALYRLKGRKASQPLILLGSCLSSLKPFCAAFPPLFEELAARHWPGPLTLIVPASSCVPDLIHRGTECVGLRVPNHPVALELLWLSGPLAVTSANLSGCPPCTGPDAMTRAFGSGVYLLDGPPKPLGVPSTILKCEGDRFELLREGSLKANEFGAKFGPNALACGKQQ